METGSDGQWLSGPLYTNTYPILSYPIIGNNTSRRSLHGPHSRQNSIQKGLVQNKVISENHTIFFILNQIIAWKGR